MHHCEESRVGGAGDRALKGTAERARRLSRGPEQHRHRGTLEHLGLGTVIQHGEPRRHVGLERELLEQPGAEGMDGLDLEAPRRLQRSGEQRPRPRAFPGIDGGDADFAQGRIEGGIVERDPATEPVVDPRRHVGGRRLGEGDAEDARRIDPARSAVEHQPDHPLGQHMGLARAGIGRDEGRAGRIRGVRLLAPHRVGNLARAHVSPSSTPPASDHSLTRARSS